MKIGVFGGTFNPVHIGHLILAAEALDQLDLDHIFWVLTPDPPHKINRQILQLSHRLRMLELAIGGNAKFLLSRVDIERNPPYYASDTIQILKEISPDAEIYYLMGLDSLNDLCDWYKPENLIKLCDGIVVMIRHDEDISAHKVIQKYPELKQKLHVLTTPVIEISATDIRLRVANGMQYRYFLHEKVYQYIVENKLYIDHDIEDIKSISA